MPSKKQIDDVWEKAKPIKGINPDVWRKDPLGKKIRKPSYGTEGQYGWEIDHIMPKARRGTDDLRNLQPLNWQDNRKKQDTYPFKK